MNLNPDDDHIMDYTTKWDDKYDIGDTNLALVKDYLSQEVWNMPANSIVIVRHRTCLPTASSSFVIEHACQQHRHRSSSKSKRN